MEGNPFDYYYGRSKVNLNLAKIYEQMGKNQQAVVYYRKFLEQWKKADTNLADYIYAKSRLTELQTLSINSQ